ncbi:hypothetical protein G4B88_029833, partial [Cannabis sativa]
LNPNPDDNSAGYIELLNRRLLHWVNSSGKIYVSHTIVGGIYLFGLVCFRLNPNPDDNSTSYIELLNRRLLHWVNSSGKIYVSHTIVGGIYVLRFSVGMEPLLRKSVMSLPPGS